MTKSLEERVFDAVFSGFKCVDWHIDCWNSGLDLKQGIIVGIKGDSESTTDVVWAGYAGGGGMKCQLRVEAQLNQSLGNTKNGDEQRLMTVKSCWAAIPENGCSRDRFAIRRAIGQNILNLCKSFGSIELDLGLRGDVFFKAQSLEELILKVDLLGDDAYGEEDKED